MNSEVKNYFRRCTYPYFAFYALVNFCIRIFWALLRRIVPGFRIFTQPKAISRARRELLAIKTPKVDLVKPSHINPGRLKLTGDWLEYTDKPNWSATFPDPEIHDSLHRWNWLLFGVTDESEKITRDQGLNLMRSWLCECLHQKCFGEDAYSTSERIVNGSIFLLRTGDGIIPSDLQFAFQYMGRQIANHLEYYEGDLTGNHAFNNARGLLFSGAVASLSGAVKLALAISNERLPKLITKDGFLREGSSHYHFLFTRWVLEMCWIAQRSNHAEIAGLLESFAGRLVERCWFFLVKEHDSERWQIPLFGDVSPDFSPDWLISLPWSDLSLEVYKPLFLPKPPVKTGWSLIFGIGKLESFNEQKETLSFPESFWHRIEFGEFTLFVFARAEYGKLIASHKHNDLGSFVLYLKGKPVLIDSGRLDYTNSLMSKYGKEAKSHNSLFINNFPPSIDEPSWFHKGYSSVAVNTSIAQTQDSSIFIIKHSGFMRLIAHKINHERRFKLTYDSFSIEDRIAGFGEINLHLRFHWAPDLKYSNNKELSFHENFSEISFVPDKKLMLKKYFDSEDRNTDGSYSPEYGVLQKCLTTDLWGKFELPITILNQIYIIR